MTSMGLKRADTAAGHNRESREYEGTWYKRIAVIKSVRSYVVLVHML